RGRPGAGLRARERAAGAGAVRGGHRDAGRGLRRRVRALTERDHRHRAAAGGTARRAAGGEGGGRIRSRGGQMIEQRLLAFTLLGAGWVLWLLVALSVLSVTVMLERALYFGQRRMSKRFPEILRLCQDGSLEKAAQLAGGDAMEAEVVRVAARAAPSGQEAVEKAVASTIDRRRLEYERWLFVLGTLGNNAPFIGLFGTVLGIIRAFAD